MQTQAVSFGVWDHVGVSEAISDHALVAKEEDAVEAVLEEESSVDGAYSRSGCKESWDMPSLDQAGLGWAWNWWSAGNPCVVGRAFHMQLKPMRKELQSDQRTKWGGSLLQVKV